jgi:acyl-CoA reductase-like NAD-dependent aldehyde dehydrogenase
VEAAKRAIPAWSATTPAERRGYLQNLADAFQARRDDMISALVEEFGTTRPTAGYIVDQSSDWFVDAQRLLTEETFIEQVGRATVNYETSDDRARRSDRFVDQRDPSATAIELPQTSPKKSPENQTGAR